VGSVQKIRDELDEVKVERDNLAKKANTLDKFKQKLKETQNLEHENRELQRTLEEIKIEQKMGDSARQELAGVRMMIQQYRSTVEKVEQDNHELLTLKRHLEIENSALAQKLSSGMEQQARDTELIQDLQDKIRDLEAGALPGQATSIEDDLDTELVYSDESKTDLSVDPKGPTDNELLLTSNRKLEIATLKAEIQSLKEGGGSGAKVVMLEGLLEDARLSRDKYLKLYLDDHQAKLVLESQLSAIQGGTLTEGFATDNH
jgi:protein HOOK3